MKDTTKTKLYNLLVYLTKNVELAEKYVSKLNHKEWITIPVKQKIISTGTIVVCVIKNKISILIRK